MISLPARLIVRRYVIRTAAFWFGARALIVMQLSLADQPPFAFPSSIEWLTAQLRRLAESGVAVVVTGHEVPVLLARADHITWCTSGTTYELGSPNVAVQDDRFCREYLGPRYSGMNA